MSDEFIADDIDRAIVEQLRYNGRATNQQIADRLDLTAATVSARIRRMEEKCAELYGQQKIRGFLHLYIGEEAVATGEGYVNEKTTLWTPEGQMAALGYQVVAVYG